MTYISTPEDLEAWLRGKPKSLSLALSLRIAMRVFPFLGASDNIRDRRDFPRLVLANFRALQSASVMAVWPWNMGFSHWFAHKNATDVEVIERAAGGAVGQFTSLPRQVFGHFNVTSLAASEVGQSLAFCAGSHGEYPRYSFFCFRDSLETLRLAGLDHRSLTGEVAADVNALERAEDFGSKDQPRFASVSTQLCQSPLWRTGAPFEFESQWKRLRANLVATAPESAWQVWISWYEAAQKGEFGQESLSREICLIWDEDWQHEDNPLHVNRIIQGLVAEHLQPKLPDRPIARLDGATGQVALAEPEIADAGLYDRLCDQVQDALILFGSERSNIYSDLSTPIQLLDYALSNRRAVPLTIHRRMVQSAVLITELCTKWDHLRDDQNVKVLADDLGEAIRHIPDAVPQVAEEIEKRMGANMVALQADDVKRLRDAVDLLRDASTEEVAEFVDPAIGVLEERAAGEPFEGELDQMRVFSLGWMLFDVSRLGRQLDEYRKRVVDGSDQVTKVAGAISAAKNLYGLVLRLLS